MEIEKLRKFENFTSFLDDVGEPLVGRLVFSVDTNPASVYDCNGTDLGSYILTDSFGRTATQVFLEKTKTYEVQIEKYIGVNTMSEDADDTEAWLPIGYCIDTATASNSGLVESSVPAVSTVSTLRSIYEVSYGTIVELLGYNEAGDKPAIKYRWDSTCTEPDNGGSIISRSGYAGAWIMIQDGAECDVRHFGAFPKEAHDYDSEQVGRIVECYYYCFDNSLIMAFNAKGLYDISGNSFGDVKMAPGAQLYCRHGYQATLVNVHSINPFFYYYNNSSDPTKSIDGTIYLHTNTVRMQDINMCPNVEFNCNTFIIDSGISNRTIAVKNAKVYLKDNLTSVINFTNCEIIPGPALVSIRSACTFTKCKVYLDCFANKTTALACTYNQCEFVYSSNVFGSDYAAFVDLTRYSSVSKTGVSDLSALNIDVGNEVVSPKLKALRGVFTPSISNGGNTVNVAGTLSPDALDVTGNSIFRNNITSLTDASFNHTNANRSYIKDRLVIADGESIAPQDGSRLWIGGNETVTGTLSCGRFRNNLIVDVSTLTARCQIKYTNQLHGGDDEESIVDIPMSLYSTDMQPGTQICLRGTSNDWNNTKHYLLAKNSSILNGRNVMMVDVHAKYGYYWDQLNHRQQSGESYAFPTIVYEYAWVTWWSRDYVSLVLPETLESTMNYVYLKSTV